MLICLLFFMDFLEVLYQVIDMRNIKEFPNNVRRFNVSNRLDVFLDCFIEIILKFKKNISKSKSIHIFLNVLLPLHRDYHHEV